MIAKALLIFYRGRQRTLSKLRGWERRPGWPEVCWPSVSDGVFGRL